MSNKQRAEGLLTAYCSLLISQLSSTQRRGLKNPVMNITDPNAIAGQAPS
jgi:hypothetical protein